MKYPTRSIFASVVLLASTLTLLSATAADKETPATRKATPASPAPATVLPFNESFDTATPAGEKLPRGWHATTGTWRFVDGVLRGTEIAEDKHSAALRRLLPMQNGIFEMRFRLLEGTTSFHFGFDPARGELDKRGHLFSVIVTPNGWSILKHIDKDKPKEDPNEVLIERKEQFEAGTWYQLKVKKLGDEVVASIEGREALTASHPTFHVKTPTLVLRSIGGEGIEIDDLKVSGITPADDKAE